MQGICRYGLGLDLHPSPLNPNFRDVAIFKVRQIPSLEISRISRLMVRLPAFLFFAGAAFLMDCLHGMAEINDALFAQTEFQAAQWQQGFLATANAIGYSVGCLIFGPLSEKTGRRIIVIIAVAGVCLSSFGLIFAPSISILTAASTLRRIFLSMFWPPLMAWMADRSTPGSFPLNLCVFNIGWTLGAATGRGLVGSIGEWAAIDGGYNAGTPYCISGILALILLFFVATCDPVSRVTKGGLRLDFRSSVGPLLLKQAWITIFVGYAVINVTVYMLPKLIEFKSLDLTESSQSFVHGARILTGLAIFLAMLVSRHWQGKQYPIYIVLFLAAAGLLLIALALRFEIFLVAAMLIGSAIGIAFTLSLFYSLSIPAEKGRGSAIHEALIGLGGGVGPLFAGAAGSLTGNASVPFYATIGFVGLCALVNLMLYRRQRQRRISS